MAACSLACPPWSVARMDHIELDMLSMIVGVCFHRRNGCQSVSGRITVLTVATYYNNATSLHVHTSSGKSFGKETEISMLGSRAVHFAKNLEGSSVLSS